MSTEKKQNIHLYPAALTEDIVIREGAAAPIIKPKPTRITGTIDAPAEYLRVRLSDPSTDFIVFDKNAGKITYIGKDYNENYTKVVGLMKLNQDLVEFGINNKAEVSPIEMARHLKFRRMFFPNKDAFDLLVYALNNLTAKIDTEIEKAKDDRGNKTDLVKKTVNSNLPKDFKLEIPIYVGGDPRTFNVEIGVDTTEGSVKVWLESPELKELMDQERNAAMESALSGLPEELIKIEGSADY